MNYNYNAIMSYTQVRLWCTAIYDDITCSIRMRVVQHIDCTLNSLKTPQICLTCKVWGIYHEDFGTKFVALYLHSSACVCAVRNHNINQCWASSMMPFKVIMPPLLHPFNSFAAVNPVSKPKVQQLQQEVMEAQLEYFKMATKSKARMWKTYFGNSSSKGKNSISYYMHVGIYFVIVKR